MAKETEGGTWINVNGNDKIYDYIYDHIVKTSVDAIKVGNYDFAYNRYKSSVIALEEKFAKPKIEKSRVLKLSLN